MSDIENIGDDRPSNSPSPLRTTAQRRSARRERGEPGSPLRRPRRREDPAPRGPAPPPRDRGGQQARRRRRPRLRQLDPAGAAVRRPALERAVARDPRADRRADRQTGRHHDRARGRVRAGAARPDPRRGRPRAAAGRCGSPASSASTDRAGSCAASSRARPPSTRRRPRQVEDLFRSHRRRARRDARCRRATSSRCGCRRVRRRGAAPTECRDERTADSPGPSAPTSRAGCHGAELPDGGGEFGASSPQPREGRPRRARARRDAERPRPARALGGIRGIAEAIVPGLVFLVVYTLTSRQDPSAALVPRSGIRRPRRGLHDRAHRRRRASPRGDRRPDRRRRLRRARALDRARARTTSCSASSPTLPTRTALLVSLLVRWPLIGLVVGFLMGDGTGVAQRPAASTARSVLTLVLARAVRRPAAVQLPFYFAGNVEGLGATTTAHGRAALRPRAGRSRWLVVRAVYPSSDAQPPK